jgi:hypothetical protein
MDQNPISRPNTNNYLYYVIKDEEQKIRGHIIGVPHSVERKDADLNPEIINAIKRSSLAVLEIPPHSKLLPTESNSDRIINREFKKIQLHPSEPEIDSSLEDGEIKDYLKSIFTEVVTSIDNVSPSQKESDFSSVNGAKLDENLNPTTINSSPLEDFKKVLKVVNNIQSSKDKLTFLKAIQRDIFEFKQVSAEEHINKIIEANNIPFFSLEDIDLAKLIKEADQQIDNRKLKSKNQEEIQPIDEVAEMRKPMLLKEFYSAWVEGDTTKLEALVNESFELYKEPPEIAKVHDTRDVAIAKRIVNVVLEVKANKTHNQAASFVMGSGHLVQKVRKNVLKYLDDYLKTALRGWSIVQVKNK